jgi:hypothetical protein
VLLASNHEPKVRTRTSSTKYKNYIEMREECRPTTATGKVWRVG